jgi:ankyrin repeat protein
MNKKEKLKKIISKVFSSKQENFNAAVKNNDVEKVKLLLKKMFFNPAIYNDYAIEISSKNGYTEIVKLLLEDKRVNPAPNFHNYPLVYASLHGHTDIVDLLLKDKRVNPTADNNYSISLAFRNKHEDVVALLWNNQSVKNTLEKSDAATYNAISNEVIKKEIRNNLNNF